MSTFNQDAVEWQAGFLAMLPAIATHAQFKFRKLAATTREESVQEAIAAAVVSYRNLVLNGRLHVAHSGAIATHAVHHVCNGRHIGGHQDAARDVLSPVCQRRHQVRVQSYDGSAAGGAGDVWHLMAIADRKASVPDLVAFRIDFANWLGSHPARDRNIIMTLASGEQTHAVAQRFGISRGRVSQLRRKYEQDWRTMQSVSIAATPAA